MLTNEQKQRIDRIFDLWVQHRGAGGQLVVTHKGETVYEQCYCYMDVDTMEPITQDTIFAVASVSKQITAMSIMILHDRGIINIHDDVSKYLPEVAQYPQKFTISHMLHHTSGLRECLDLNSIKDKPEGYVLTVPGVMEIMAKQKSLDFEPGTKFVYNNSGYMMMAALVERVSGMNMHEFAKKNIFDPLGMTSSYFRGCLDYDIPGRAVGHHDDGTTYTRTVSNSRTYGSGGLVTTCRDMAKFMPQYKNPTLVSRETMDLYLTIPPLADGTVTNYACGVRINELLGHKYYHHGGVTGGFRAFTVLFPDDDLVVCVFTNTYNIPIETAGRDVARIVLGLPEREKKDPTRFKGEEVNIETAAGYYLSKARTKSYHIKVEDGKAYVRFNNKWAPLYHEGGNMYKMGRRNIAFFFGEDPMVFQEGGVHELVKMTAVPADIAPYVGKYYSAEAEGTFTVSIEDGTLMLTTPARVKEPLFLIEGELFNYGSMTSTPKNIRFNRDETGKVVSLNYSSPMMSGLKEIPDIKGIEFKKET